MSATTNRKDGSTVVPVTSGPEGVWPLFGLVRALCCSPLCCSVSEHLRRVQGGSQSALGATQIMVGAVNIVLGIMVGKYWREVESWYPLMLGFLFAAFGTLSILSEKYPSRCLVIASVIANLAGVAFAIAAISLYCFFDMSLYGLCQRSGNEYWFHEWIEMPRIPSVEEKIMMKKCREAREMAESSVDPDLYKAPLLKDISTISV